MATSLITKPITLDELQAVDGLDEYKGIEIVDGMWTPKHSENSMSIPHGKFGARLIGLLVNFVDANALGEVYMSETMFVMNIDPDGVRTMRKPDIAFVTADRVISAEGLYYFQAPDLAVEVISPSDRRPGVLHKKLTDYFTYGTQQVWLVDYDEKRIIVQNADGSATTLSSEDVLHGGDLLPGFTLNLADFFDA